MNQTVVSIGHFPALYVVLVPLEYVPTMPHHSSYIIDICFVLFKRKGDRNTLAPQHKKQKKTNGDFSKTASHKHNCMSTNSITFWILSNLKECLSFCLKLWIKVSSESLPTLSFSILLWIQNFDFEKKVETVFRPWTQSKENIEKMFFDIRSHGWDSPRSTITLLL